MLNTNFTLKKHRLRTSILFALAFPTAVWASATLDGSMGTTGSFSGTGSDFTITESVGKLEGTNLFHSFSDFSVNSGESATFTGTSPINNVVSRVTGSSSTEINGGLTSTISGSNFYFINPNGIVFKEGAAISVDGSFYASTADYLKLEDGSIINANISALSTFTSSPPSSFGFLNSNIGSITLQGTQLLKYANYSQPSDATFSLIGGNISVEQASSSNTFLAANGIPGSTGSYIGLLNNRFEIISVASSGEAVLTNGGYDLSSFNTLGDVSISGGSIIDTNDIYIRGGNIVINDSMILPGYSSLLLGFPQANGGMVDIAATDQFYIIGTTPMGTFASPYFKAPDGTSFLAGITTFGGVTIANAAGINISAKNISISGAAEIKSIIQGTGTAGDINISGEIISLTNSAAIKSILRGDPVGGTAADINISGDRITVSNNATIRGSRITYGSAGDINITGNIVEVLNGGLIANSNTFFGSGGNITINANQVVLDGQDTTSVSGTGLTTISDFNTKLRTNYAEYYANADAGNITVNATGANGLTIKNGAYISTESRSFGTGGDISITASNINLSRDGKSVGAIASQSLYAGDAGDITINATGDIDINSGFEISATTAGMGTGGDISITAGKTINISGENSIISSAAPEPIDAVKDYLGYAMIGSNSFSNLLTAFGLPSSSSMYDVLGALQGFFGYPSGTAVAGNAGSITLQASSLNMNDNSRITTSTSSDGNGGALSINVEKLAMKNNSEIRSRSGLYVDGSLEVGSGNGGNISVVASNSISMKSGSSISASSLGTGLAGDVYLDAGKILDLTNSSITTQATIADGGNITIRAIDQIYLDKSNITTSVENGTGSGGNIDIDPKFFIIKSSNILANAYGGTGGNIVIVAENLLSSAGSTIDASSALGVDGNVNITSPDEDVAEELTVLTDNYLDVTSLISERCGTSTGSSSLVNAGPAGMAIDPDGYLPSFSLASYDNNLRTSGSSSSKKHWAKPYIDESNMMLAQLSCNTL